SVIAGAAMLTCVLVRVAKAIDGPTASAISNANWGTANDAWPFVARLEIDKNNADSNGDNDLFNDPLGATGDTFCTAQLIPPHVLVTAAHCVRDIIDVNGNAPAGRVAVNFGNLPNGPSTFINTGGKSHPLYVHGSVPREHDLAYITLGAAPDP